MLAQKKKPGRKRKYNGVLYPIDWMDMGDEVNKDERMTIDLVKALLDQHIKKMSAACNEMSEKNFQDRFLKHEKVIMHRKTFNEFVECNERHYTRWTLRSGTFSIPSDTTNKSCWTW